MRRLFFSLLLIANSVLATNAKADELHRNACHGQECWSCIAELDHCPWGSSTFQGLGASEEEAYTHLLSECDQSICESTCRFRYCVKLNEVQ